MMKYTKWSLFLVLSLYACVSYAQKSTSGGGSSKNKKSKTTNTATSKTKKTQAFVLDEADTTKASARERKRDSTMRDSQNQLQFFEPDLESKRYNFYRRRDISTPLMPRYDLDSAAFQRGKKRDKQQQSYLEKQYPFPAKPKDKWELGVNFGLAMISGDVLPYLRNEGLIQNLGLGVSIRKSFGYTFSMRFGYNFMMMTGRNWEADGNLKFNQALRGVYDPRVDYWDNPNLVASKTKDSLDMRYRFFYNYRTYVHEAHLAVIASFGNIRFHRERNIMNFYLLGGVSSFLFRTKMDALDGNGHVYDLSEVWNLYLQPGTNQYVNQRYKDQRKEAYKLLKQIYDGKYETPAEHENNVPGFKYWQIVPAATVGFGIQLHATKWMTIGIEERVILTGSDLLDGYRWQQDEHDGFTRDYDNISYTSISLNFHLGGKKRVEPLYWMNPVYHSYRKLNDMQPEAIAQELFKDTDDDGVPDYLDREPNTKKGCPVDSHGVTLDSDHDGIPDCYDKEPYSPPGYLVDSTGTAIVPPNPCCDTTRYRGGPVNNAQPPIIIPVIKEGDEGAVAGGFDCSRIELPSVIFDNDKYYIDPQYYGSLHQIAQRMQLCPDVKLVITGYDASRNDQKYNEQLGWHRSNTAVEYLVDKYGISRDRFIVKYQGGRRAATGTAYEKKMKNRVEFRYAGEGENGDSNPPAPHPGLKAGSNK